MKIKIVLKSNEPEYYQVGQTWFLNRSWYTVTYQFTFLCFRYVVLRNKNLNKYLATKASDLEIFNKCKK